MAEKKQTTATKETGSELVFTKKNYQLLLISIAIVAVGFILMMGTTDIYDTRKTLIAPLVVLFGFGFGIYAVLKK
ncbi:DUF3098 domain-containing protein [Pedobacter sp. SYP-B3415]|uniref:DUF3098 domain-containing protein n=1 Tax=Pedobacter sp. SYP-B3415 TaxID=2496641 RepID=UPI00101C4471|nr:DUF3098 domain-containing protein [Pedobacter sp. SYP-B3415]